MPRFLNSVITSVAVVVAAAVAVAARPSSQTTPAAALPSAAEVIARHIKALGGAEAWKAISSLQIRGTFELPGQGVTGNLELFAARPASMLLRVTLDGVGRIENGFNGTHGWSINPMAGAALLEGRELQETKDDAWFDSTLYAADHVKSMTVVGREEFDKRQAYKLQIVLQSGRDQFEFFDVDTGIQIGSEGRRETPMGVVPTVSVLRGFKTFDGILQPTEMVQRALGIEQVVRIASIQANTVAPSTFDPPAEIKALIKAPGRR